MLRTQCVRGAFLIAALVGVLSGTAEAQPAGNFKAEITSIKAELAELQSVAAQAPTFAQAVQELSAKVSAIEEELAKHARISEGMPVALEELDALKTEMAKLQSELEYLRTDVANVEAPAAVGGGGGGSMERQGGYKFTTADGRWSARFFGLLQTRLEFFTPGDFSSLDTSTFRMERGRFGLNGQLGSPDWTYLFNFQLESPNPVMLDLFVTKEFRPWFKVRVGQEILPFTRSFMTRGRWRAFLEHSETQSLHRLDRDIGVEVLGELMDGKLRYYAMMANGSGPATSNDNIDFVTVARGEYAALGEYIGQVFGDVEGSEEHRLTLGGAVMHDLVPVPGVLAGIELGNVDVDNNGDQDNVRVVGASLDAIYWYKGLELYFEMAYRHERWGTILEHGDNVNAANAVRPDSDGVRNYLGFIGHASYFVIPGELQVATRLSHGRLPLLGLSGRLLNAAPPAERILQTDNLIQLWRGGQRLLGFQYSFLNYNAKEGQDPQDDTEHRFMLEAQLSI